MIFSARGWPAYFARLWASQGLRWWLRVTLIFPALAVFALSLALPAVGVRIMGGEPSPEPGYFIAYVVEASLFEMGEQLARGIGGAPAGNRSNLTDGWPMFVGAAANHLFALGCLATLFNRLRLAAAFAGLALLAAIGCLLPMKALRLEPGLTLATGYFVWCAAPLVLLVVLAITLTHVGDRGKSNSRNLQSKADGGLT